MLELSVLLALIDDEDDKNKFMEIYNRYEGLMYSRAYARLRDYHLAEDMVNEAMLKIAKNIHMTRVDNENMLKGFVIQVLENTVTDYYRKNRGNREVIVDRTDIFQKHYRQEENIELSPLAGAIVELPELYRTVIQLRYYQGYKTEDIARILGVSVVAVEKRLSRAKKMMKKSLKEEGIIL